MTICRWFAGCGREATTTQHHPILGDVPICERCQAWYDRMAADPTKAYEKE